MPSKNAVELARSKFPQVKQAFIAFKGGIDAETPPLFAASGSIRESQNYECDVLGGYKRIRGYERFSGKAKPSDAAYAVLNVNITGAFAVGNTITGATSGATGVVLAVVVGTTSYLVITKITGAFLSGENLTVAAVVQGVTTSLATVDGASTPLLHAQYKNLAADNYRADIAAVPGEGSVLGVVRMNAVTYAFRNAAGGASAAIYKSSGTGWTAVPLGEEISFTAGAVGVDEGDTLTQGGVTATIKRIVLTSGSFAGGTAAGRLIIYGRAGGNYAAGAATTTGGGALTLSGAQTAIAIAPGGHYRFIIENFAGSTSTKRIYGADGANRGFEFDGSDYSYTPISTGMASDLPCHVISNRNHLFFAFTTGSVQHSAPGQPYVWSVILGASELNVGDEVTGLAVQPGSETTGALSIFTKNRTYVLYGTSVSNWVLVRYRDELGCIADTIQDIGYTIFLDHNGVTNFQTAQAYGNFSHSAISEKLRSWLNQQRTKAISSCISRDRSQYRLFFSDQYALYVTINRNKIVGMGQIFLAHQAKCAWSSEESDGSETIFFGSTNGMVYQMEKGTSLDGDAIEHYLHIAFDFLKSPRTLKNFKEAMLEITGEGYTAFQFAYELGYGDSNVVSQPAPVSKTASFSPRVWDAVAAVWDALFWDGRQLSKSNVDLGGTAENISLMFRGSSDYDSPIRFSGSIIHYIPRRNIR